MNKLRLFFTTGKLCLIGLILAVVIVSSGQNMASLTQAVFTSSVQAVANKISTGYWQPATPVFEGFNLNTQSSLPNEQPLDLGCGVLTNGGDPLSPKVALNWQAVKGSRVIYQREQIDPNGLVKTDFYETNPYTDFLSFESDPGLNGLWQWRVRAFEDVNLDGIFTSEVDLASEWSNYCQLTLDSLPPAVAFTNIPLVNPLVTSIKTFSLRGTLIDPHLASYQLKIYQSDGAGSSGGNLVADSGLIATTDSPYERDLYVWQIDQLNGYYLVELSATDSLTNTQTIHQLVQIINPNPAGSTITVTNSPEKEIVNRVKNSSFEQGLNEWQAVGQIIPKLAEEVDGAKQGDWLAQLSLSQDPNQAGPALLSQSIDNQGKGLRAISFWYKLAESFTTTSVESPLFTVWVNDQLKFQVALDQLQAKNWQMASIYVADLDVSNLKLSFKLEDPLNLTTAQLYLDQITTDVTVVNQEALFTLYSQNPANTAQVFYQYALGGQTIQNQGDPGLSFKLTAQPDKQELFFWTVNHLGIESAKNRIEVLVDNSAPHKISDLKAYNEGEGEYSLEFTAPADNVFSSVRNYEVRYSTQPITAETDWQNLAQAEFLESNVLLSRAQAPLPAGSAEILVLKNLDVNENYYFAIKSFDVAGNISALSNVATAQMVQSQAEIINLPVVINEIAYNPVGDDSGQWQTGEWVELYNQGDKELNLANWSIVDAAGKSLTITSANSDNNLNLADAGETIIPAHGWLVVYKNGARFLNNDGDSLALYNQNHLLVDAYFYQALAAEGQTEARVTDGVDEWSFASLATPGRPNAVALADLQAQAKLYQQDLDQMMIKIFDANNYQTAQYTLTYNHLYEGQTVAEAITGEIKIDSSMLEINDLYLGTCSTGGICMPHLEIDSGSFSLTVQLVTANGEAQVLTSNLSGDWQE